MRSCHMAFLRRLVCTVVLSLVATAVTAQGWQGSTRDDASYLHGMVDFNQGALTIWCNAPSPQGVDPQVSDANLIAPMAPYTVRLLVGKALTDVPSGTPRVGAVLWVDGQGGRVPLQLYAEEQSLWSVDLPMTDPAVQRLLQGQNFTVQIEGGTHWDIGTKGLNPALQSALSYCAGGWQQAGHALPGALVGQAAAPAGAPPDYPQFILVGSVVTRFYDSLQQQADTACGGPATLGDTVWRTQNMDGDGTEDHVLDWNEVQCAIGIPPKCKQHACMVDVMLSSTPGAPAIEILGRRPQFVPGPKGRAALRFDRLLTGCATPDQPLNCGAAVIHWNGQALEARFE